jgi:DNA-binding LacI/PurR family transcriptional regulator
VVVKDEFKRENDLKGIQIMTTENHRITIKDVAREAGVSHVTVSYVLNKTPGRTISAATSERVAAAIRKLDYHPYAPARSLRSGKSKIVLVVWPYGVVETGLSEFIDALTSAVTAIGFSLVTQIGSPQEITNLAMNLSPTVVIGLQLDYDPAFRESLMCFNTPLILAGNTGQPEQGPMLQVEYLTRRDKRQIVFAATEKSALHSLCEKRLNEVRKACRANNLSEPIVVNIPESRVKARQILANLLTELPPPFGICAFNDDVAFPVLAALADLNIKVPEEVSVIGHDNSKIGEFCCPALTSVSLGSPDIFNGFIENIITVCQGGTPAEDVIPHPKVIVRGSA